MQDLLRRWRDNPNVVWGIGYLGLVLLVFLLVGIIAALFGNSPEEEEEASASIAEETTVEEKTARERTAREEAAGGRERSAREEPPSLDETSVRMGEKPKPSDPDERIRFNLQDALTKEIGDTAGEDVKVAIQPDQGGCRYVTANYQTLGSTSIELEMRLAYEAINKDQQTRGYVCRLTVNAYGTVYDKYGQSSLEHHYTTHMDRDTANRINWQDTSRVKFSELWTVD